MNNTRGKGSGPAPTCLRAGAAVALTLGLWGCAAFFAEMPAGPEPPAEDPVATAGRAIDAGDLAAAEPILEAALAKRPEPPTSPDPETAALLTTAARLRIRQQRSADAERDIERALPLVPDAGPLPAPTSKRAIHYVTAEAYQDAGRDPEAASHLTAAHDLCLADTTLSEADACETERSALVRLYVATGRYSDAEPLVLARVADVQAHNGAYDLRLADAIAAAASFYCRQGQYELCGPLYVRSFDIWRNFRDEAVVAYRKAVEAGLESPFGADFIQVRARHSPFTAPTGLDEQAPLLYKLGKPNEAAAAVEYERRLWLADPTAGPKAMNALNAIVAAGSDGMEEALAQEAVGYVYFKRGDHPHAEEHYRRALAQMEALWPSFSITWRRRLLRDYLDILSTLAQIDRAAERHDEAVELGQKAMGLAELQLDSRDSLRLDTIASLAKTYREARNVPKADEFSVRYLDAVSAARGTDHPDYAWALRNLAYVYLLEDDIPRSENFEAQARRIWARHPAIAPQF